LRPSEATFGPDWSFAAIEMRIAFRSRTVPERLIRLPKMFVREPIHCDHATR
jgi:hypothetical protein